MMRWMIYPLNHHHLYLYISLYIRPPWPPIMINIGCWYSKSIAKAKEALVSVHNVLSVLQYPYRLRQPYFCCLTFLSSPSLLTPPPLTAAGPHSICPNNTTISSTPAILASDPPQDIGKKWAELLCIMRQYSDAWRYRFHILQDHCPYGLLHKGVIPYTIGLLPCFLPRSPSWHPVVEPTQDPHYGGGSPHMYLLQRVVRPIRWPGRSISMYVHLWPPDTLSSTYRNRSIMPFGYF